MSERSIEIAKFGHERPVIVDGWSVPLLTAHEEDGGKVLFVIDRRLGCSVDADHFDRVASFLADVIGTCWGYGAHPRGDDEAFAKGMRSSAFSRVPHPSLAPRRMVEISAVQDDGLDSP